MAGREDEGEGAGRGGSGLWEEEGAVCGMTGDRVHRMSTEDSQVSQFDRDGILFELTLCLNNEPGNELILERR